MVPCYMSPITWSFYKDCNRVSFIDIMSPVPWDVLAHTWDSTNIRWLTECTHILIHEWNNIPGLQVSRLWYQGLSLQVAILDHILYVPQPYTKPKKWVKAFLAKMWHPHPQKILPNPDWIAPYATRALLPFHGLAWVSFLTSICWQFCWQTDCSPGSSCAACCSRDWPTDLVPAHSRIQS
jgi:hypothetical protein